MEMRRLYRPALAIVLLACGASTAGADDAVRFRWFPSYYLYHTAHNGTIRTHHDRAWRYVDGKDYGFPYSLSKYKPRATGATYNFGYWAPQRSHYFPYQEGVTNQAPYGYSPEPYYHQKDVPIDPGLRRRADRAPCPALAGPAAEPGVLPPGEVVVP